MIFLSQGQAEDFTGYTVIIPGIAVGNVGQLSVDLWIATLSMRRVGMSWHPALMPIFGPTAYQHDIKNKTTACDLYADAKNKLLIFQFRSPLVPSYLSDFLHRLVDFLTEKKIARVVILTSSHAYEKHTVDTMPFEFMANEQFRSTYDMSVPKKNWLEFEGSVIHGGGCAQKLLNICTECDIPAFVLFKYVSEGDNSPDAQQLLIELNRMLNILKNEPDGRLKLTIPVSWNYLFGNDLTEAVF